MPGKEGIFMEILKKHIRTNQIKGKAAIQVTLDDDFNVPDVKPDIDKIIEETGEIKIEEIKAVNDKVLVRGKLEFAVLYISSYSERPLHNMSGMIHFEESVNMDKISEDDEIKVSWDMEDLRTSLINSRKLSVRSILSLSLTAGQINDEEVATEVIDDENICILNRELDVSQIQVRKKDIFRIKEEIAIPANKPNVLDILWDNAVIDSLDIKLTDEQINLRGDIGIFILYAGAEEKNPLPFFNMNVAFNGSVDCGGAKEEMIGNINGKIIQRDMEVKQDADGEPRSIAIDIVLELDIAVYDEAHIEILSDVYAVNRNLMPERQKTIFDNILVKNESNCKLQQKIKIKNDQSKILQICQTNGNIKIDRTEITDEGILVEGVVYVQILYIAADDKVPINAIKGMIPFSHMIEVAGMTPECVYEINPVLEQINSMMLDSEEIEVKSILTLNTIVFSRTEMDIIVHIEEQPFDLKEIEALPNIVGYIVRPEDTMWELAKKFYTTSGQIMEINDLSSEELIPNQRLVITKNNIFG